MTELKPQGIVEQLNSLTIQKIEGNELLANLKKDLEESDLYKRVRAGEEHIAGLAKQETELKEHGKQMLITSGIKKFEALDGTIIQLNKKPGKLIIENEDNIGDEYRKVKTTTTIDKKALKEDITEGVIIEGVSVEIDYNLVIKQK